MLDGGIVWEVSRLGGFLSFVVMGVLCAWVGRSGGRKGDGFHGGKLGWKLMNG